MSMHALLTRRLETARMSAAWDHRPAHYRFPRRDDCPGWWELPRALHRSRDLLVLIVSALAVAIVATLL
jgi:hypothetical protein